MPKKKKVVNIRIEDSQYQKTMKNLFIGAIIVLVFTCFALVNMYQKGYNQGYLIGIENCK